MRKIIFLVMSLLLISTVSALSIGSIRYFEDIFLVNLHNTRDYLEDVKVKIMVMNDDIDVYQTRTFDLDNGETRGTYVIIDKPLKETLVKITVRNDDVRRARYIII